MSGRWSGWRRALPWIALALTAAAFEAGGPRAGVLVAGGLLAIAITLTLAPLSAGARGPRIVDRFADPVLLLAASAWAAAALVAVLGPTHGAVATLGRDRAVALPDARLRAPWTSLLETLAALAAVVSGFAVRSVARSRELTGESDRSAQLAAARAIVAEHGRDSLAPFVLRPDKRFVFAAGGLLAYRVVGGTALCSGDPVGPAGCAPPLVRALRERARRDGLRVALYGCGPEHLADYRTLGLRAIQVGEEAVVDPARFTLEGRPVRKLRQSVHRVARRGWEVSALPGRDVGVALEAEIDGVERAWREDRGELLGFAMSLGPHDPGVRPEHLYLLARSPIGELCAVMRFIAVADRFSLDTMRRVGETPNGLNEALVSRALEFAREHGVSEVSLNYAGLGHLVRGAPAGGRVRRALLSGLLALLRGRFQMDRLVRFNEKFSPAWTPRYLVYESRCALPLSIVRALQAEGYLPQPRARWSHAVRRERHRRPVERAAR